MSDLREHLPVVAALGGREPTALAQLAGDASDRQFWRVGLPDDTTRVVMFYGPGHREAVREYVVMQAYLDRHGLPVPQIDEIHEEVGLVVQEDLGDHTMGSVLDSENRETWYRDALTLMLRMQRECTADDACPAFHREFDVAKLTWELEFFLRHTVRGYHGVKMSIVRKRRLEDECRRLARRLDLAGKVFAHRDYHSRNLMVTDGRLRLIDFQDARLGDPCYDVASLLRDSYVPFDEDERMALLGVYFEDARTDIYRGWWFDQFLDHFELHALQRNLKAAGSFGYLTVEKGKSQFAEALPYTYRMALSFLRQRPEWSALRELLEEVAVAPDTPGAVFTTDSGR